MRMGSLGASLVVVATLAAPVVAADPPALARAKAALEANRNDAHREKMRVVWPEGIETTPPEGAEIVVIEGYISHRLTRIVWRDGRVDARAIDCMRSWFYNEQGERFDAFEFDFAPEKFASVWGAARLLAGAREERVSPKVEAKSERKGVGFGSHDTEYYVRVAVGAEAPHHAAMLEPSGEDGEGLPEWKWLLDRSVFDVAASLIPKDGLRAVPVSSEWNEFVSAELRRAVAPGRQRRWGDVERPRELALRLAGEVGPESLYETFDAILAADPGDEWLQQEIDYARTKIRFRHRWDEKEAADRIAAGQRTRKYAELDLLAWLRKRYREANPDGYLTFTLDHPPADQSESYARDREPDSIRDLSVAVASLRAPFAPESFRLLETLLSRNDAGLRLQVARRLLEADPDHVTSLAAIRSVAWSRQVPGPVLATEKEWSRVAAIRELRSRGRLDVEDVRGRLSEEEPDHALVVDALLDFLATTPRPASDVERRDVWRRVVRGPVELGIVIAAERLLDMRDREWRIPILAALERAKKWSGPGSRELHTQAERLAERAAVEMPREAPPK